MEICIINTQAQVNKVLMLQTLVIDNDGKDIPIRNPNITPKNAVAMIFIPSFDFLLIELKKKNRNKKLTKASMHLSEFIT